MKEKLRSELKPLYKELLEVTKNKEEDTVFCMQWGEDFPKEPNTGVLFVGRAPNGWADVELDVDIIFDDKDSSKRAFARDNQMVWVEENFSYRGDTQPASSGSPFWRVVKKISTGLYPENWYDYVAWSNLYKLAPAEKGNPKNWESQLGTCRKILAKEIEILSPKFVVLLTGWNWAEDFLNFYNGNAEPKEEKSVEWKGGYKSYLYRIKGVTYIYSQHPQGKDESEHAEAILKLMGS